MSTPETRYAQSGDVNIAYQVIGGGRLDLILALGFATHVETLWELPAYAHFVERLASFARVIVFDKRGMGLSDRPSVLTTFEEPLDDLRAVLGIAPPIWRTIQVPESYSFWDLHVALQDSMGWLDYLLHLFRLGKPVTKRSGADP